MTCLNFFKIRANNPAAPQRSFIPCGECAECRKTAKNGWSFRLAVEMDSLKKLGYTVAFVTLTYRVVPVLPRVLFNDPAEHKRIPCFDKEHIQALVHHLQDKMFDFGSKYSMSYLIASELGKSTHRPHYHGVFAIPPDVPAEQFYKWLRKYWNRKHGFIIPRSFAGYNGGKPFVVDSSVRGVTAYCAKYCCKDLDFEDSLSGLSLDRKCRIYKNCRSFHVQSRSLGFSFLDGADDRLKYELLSKGYSFVGEDKFTPIPLYLRNKILFNNRYDVSSSGKRLVSREPTEFFKRWYKILFEDKVKHYERILNDCSQVAFYLNREVPESEALKYVENIRYLRSRIPNTTYELASFYVAYFGLKREYSYFIPPCDVWFNRFLDKPKTSSILFPQERFADVSRLFAYCFSALKFSHVAPDLDSDLIDQVADFHKSVH